MTQANADPNEVSQDIREKYEGIESVYNPVVDRQVQFQFYKSAGKFYVATGTTSYWFSSYFCVLANHYCNLRYLIRLNRATLVQFILFIPLMKNERGFILGSKLSLHCKTFTNLHSMSLYIINQISFTLLSLLQSRYAPLKRERSCLTTILPCVVNLLNIGN